MNDYVYFGYYYNQNRFFDIMVCQWWSYIFFTSLLIAVINLETTLILLDPIMRHFFPNVHTYGTLAVSAFHIFLCLFYFDFTVYYYPVILTRLAQLSTDVIVVLVILIFLMFFTNRPLRAILEDLVLRYPIRYRPARDIYDSMSLILVENMAIVMYSAVLFGLKHSFMFAWEIMAPSPIPNLWSDRSESSWL